MPSSILTVMVMASREVEQFEARYFKGLGDPSSRVTPQGVVRAVEEGGDPFETLGSVGMLQRWLSDQEPDLVAEALRNGASWGAIAVQLGRSKQAVWQRYRHLED